MTIVLYDRDEPEAGVGEREDTQPKFTVHFASECLGRKSREARLATAVPP
jgi:hypothetical protein